MERHIYDIIAVEPESVVEEQAGDAYSSSLSDATDWLEREEMEEDEDDEDEDEMI